MCSLKYIYGPFAAIIGAAYSVCVRYLLLLLLVLPFSVWTADEARALPADVIAAAKAEAEAVSPHAVQQLQQPSQQQQEQYKEQQYVKEQEDRNGSLVLCLVAIHNAKTRAEAPATAGATETQAVAAAAAIAAIAAFCIVCCRQRARTRKKEERRWICKSCQLKQSLR